MALFYDNEKVQMVDMKGNVLVTGTIVGLRKDSWEKVYSWPSGRYNYYVEFDEEYNNKTFDTYVEQGSLQRIPPKKCLNCKEERVCAHQTYCSKCYLFIGPKRNVRYIYDRCLYCQFFGTETKNDGSFDEMGIGADLFLMGLEDYRKGVTIASEPKGDLYKIYEMGYHKGNMYFEFNPKTEIKIDRAIMEVN